MGSTQRRPPTGQREGCREREHMPHKAARGAEGWGGALRRAWEGVRAARRHSGPSSTALAWSSGGAQGCTRVIGHIVHDVWAEETQSSNQAITQSRQWLRRHIVDD
eukprot:2879864-Prymnesium_polylepis.1